jgi:hypothetical protein
MSDAVEARDIFVSHSSEDAGVASDLVARLESLGVSCWIAPRDVQPGTTFAASLYAAIEKTPVFVVLMSSAANRSDHVARELAIADQMSKMVVPVRLEDFEATGAFCYYTRAAHFYPWYEAPDQVLARIVKQVKRVNSQAGEQGVQEAGRDHARKKHWWQFWR